MSYKIRLKIAGRCPRHKNFNPAREPVPADGVKAGCQTCQALAEIEKYRREIERVVRTLPKMRAPSKKEDKPEGEQLCMFQVESTCR